MKRRPTASTTTREDDEPTRTILGTGSGADTETARPSTFTRAMREAVTDPGSPPEAALREALRAAAGPVHLDTQRMPQPKALVTQAESPIHRPPAELEPPATVLPAEQAAEGPRSLSPTKRNLVIVGGAVFAALCAAAAGLAASRTLADSAIAGTGPSASASASAPAQAPSAAMAASGAMAATSLVRPLPAEAAPNGASAEPPARPPAPPRASPPRTSPKPAAPRAASKPAPTPARSASPPAELDLLFPPPKL